MERAEYNRHSRARVTETTKGASRHGTPIRVNIMEAVQISSLKGDQISAQGFNPGLGKLHGDRRAAEGAPDLILARHIGSKSFKQRRLFILAPLSGRIFAWRVPSVRNPGGL